MMHPGADVAGIGTHDAVDQLYIDSKYILIMILYGYEWFIIMYNEWLYAIMIWIIYQKILYQQYLVYYTSTCI